MGLSCVTALSEWLQVDIQRDGLPISSDLAVVFQGPLEQLAEAMALVLQSSRTRRRIFRQELALIPRSPLRAEERPISTPSFACL